MELAIGKYVQIFLRNGFKIEGLLKSWSNKKSTVEHNGEIIVIQKTLKDVFLIKIIDNKNKVCASPDQCDITQSPKQDPMPAHPIQEKYETAEMRTVEYVLPNIFKKPGTIQHSPEKVARKINGNYSALQDLFNKENK